MPNNSRATIRSFLKRSLVLVVSISLIGCGLIKPDTTLMEIFLNAIVIVEISKYNLESACIYSA